MTPTKTAREVAEGILINLTNRHRELNSHVYFEALQDASDKIAEAIQAERDARKQQKSDTSKPYIEESDVSRVEDYWNKTHEFKMSEKERIKHCWQAARADLLKALPDVSEYMDKGLELDKEQRASDPLAHYVEISKLHYEWLRNRLQERIKGDGV